MEHELGITKLFNDNLAGVANFFFSLVGWAPADRPWSNFMTVELLVVAILLSLPLLASGFSVDKPGKLQQVFEMFWGYFNGLGKDIIGHGSRRYIPYFVTAFLFILVSNLIGVIPAFESPTMFAAVPLGLALTTFLYFNYHGLREQGFGYIKHFAGPVAVMAPLLFPLEILSTCIRPVSLTIRLYANMVAGEQVTLGFLGLVPFLIPVVFMGLHVFVSFIQAFIFSVLSMVYVGGAVQHAEEHH
ncbi:MAG: F0F1 ATP synthase subunit A [Acidobacteria bacterium]|nr:F0F1 ATP synthase subunit A [Acidobacteriota bacterium]